MMSAMRGRAASVDLTSRKARRERRETKSSIVTQYSCCDEEEVLKSGVKVWRETKFSIVTQYSCCDEEEVLKSGV